MCGILHNLIVDMWERGKLRSEVGGGGEALDVGGECAGDIARVFRFAGSGRGNGNGDEKHDATAPPFAEILERGVVSMSE